MATVQEWDDFTQDAAQKLETARQNMEDVLNSDASQARKDEARANYEKQKRYYDLLAAKNAEIQITGIAPVSWTIDAQDINSAVYQWREDGNKYPVEIHYPLAGKVVTEEWVYATSEHFSIKMKFTQRGNSTNHMVEYSWNIPPDASNNPGYFGLKPDTNDSWLYYWTVEFSDTKGNLTSKNWTWGYSSSDIYSPMMSVNYNTIPTIGVGDVIPCGSPGGAIPIIAGNMLVVSIPQATVEDPWDYYNDELMPDINPDDRMYPNGYEPEPEPEPDDPPDEPTDIPHDDGEPPEHQRDRAVGIPSQFITQYLLSYSQLQTFGLNLWQSWLTPNTDVWKNFFLPYASDFGTLNIGACLDFIISLRVYPVDFADYLDLIGSSAGLYMGTGHTDFLGSSCAITKKLFHAFDCGTCEVKPEKPYNDFRDMYNTSISVVLPYCGTVELTPSEVMYRNLRAYYYVDFQSGACTAVVEVEGDSGWYMVASKTGQMGFLLPITATNAGQLSAQFGKDATETLGTLAGWFFDTAKTIGNGLFGMAGSYLDKKSSEEEKLMGVGRAGFDMLVNHGQTNVGTGIELVNQSLDRLSRSGIDMPMLSGGGGTEALMFPDTPYIQIRRGKYAKPENYPHSQGFLNGSSNTIEYYKGAFQGSPTIDPSYKGRGLCKFTGVDSTGLTCNNDERVEIVALLESGIYI